MINAINNHGVYNSIELQNFILQLERKYTIESAQEKYHNLVNFSTNAISPFHRWFMYREGFAGALIRELLKMSGAKSGEVIIDPFCGSGTTNVVSLQNGFNTLGLDVNPMSAYITDAKVTRYKTEDLEAALHLTEELKEKWNGNEDVSPYQNLQNYFTAIKLAGLIAIKHFIDSQNDGNVKKILFVAFLSIIIESSERKRDGNGLKVRHSKIDNVLEFYCNKVKFIVEDIRQEGIHFNCRGTSVCNSACCLHEEFLSHFPNGNAGAIVFSPPYANSFDYFESYKLELILGGFSENMKDIGKFRNTAVRSFVGGRNQEENDKFIDLISKEIKEAIPEKEHETGRPDLRTRKVPEMIRGYFADMHEIIRQCALCLPSGKKTYTVVDQSAYVGKIVPTDLLLAYFGEMEGFSVGRIIECRKARTSTQQLNKFPYLKSALRESIVELIKL